MVSTATSYAALRRRLNGIYTNIKIPIDSFLGYSRTQVASRLIQCYAEHIVFKFTRVLAEKYRLNRALPSDCDVIELDEFIVVSNVEIKIKLKKYIKLYFEYLGYWFYVLLIIIISLRFSSNRKKISLLYGVGINDIQDNREDDRFLNFCRLTNVIPIKNAKFLAVQSSISIKSGDSLYVKYGRVPLLVALKWTGLDISIWINALSKHILLFFDFISGVLCYPTLIMLGRDAALQSVAWSMNECASIESVMFTNSNYFSQPLWYTALPNKSYRSHMIWYSQNQYPISYRDEPLAETIPNLSYVEADTHWVWTDDFAEFLSVNCKKATYKVVGPIVWHMPSESENALNNSFTITLFDVTPVNNKLENDLGLIRNYYNEKTAKKFINDIIDIVKEIESRTGSKISLVLKHKREHASIHSTGYIELISKLVEKRKISLVNPTNNIHDIVIRSNIVIAAPYSSPLYIAKHHNIKAFWYDSTNSLDQDGCPMPGCMVQDKRVLQDKLNEEFSKYYKENNK